MGNYEKIELQIKNLLDKVSIDVGIASDYACHSHYDDVADLLSITLRYIEEIIQKVNNIKGS